MFNCYIAYMFQSMSCNISYMLLSVCAHSNKHSSAQEELQPINRPEEEPEKDELHEDLEKSKLHEEDGDTKSEVKESDANLKPGDDN